MRTRFALLLAAATMMVSVVALPVQAAPPVQEDIPLLLVFPDFENGKVVFWNTTRDDVCAWAEGGFVGPPPVIELVPVTFNETGKGAVVFSYNEIRPIELWNFDDPDDPVDPCVDTDEQDGPWATGDMRVSGHDNDLDVSLTRTNAFGDTGQGTVYTSDGSAWHYSWTFLAQIDQNGEFRVVNENFNLKKKGK